MTIVSFKKKKKKKGFHCCRRTNDIVFGTERCKSELILVGFEPLNGNLEWNTDKLKDKNAIGCRWRGVHVAVPV